MDARTNKLMREQVGAKLERLTGMREVIPPRKGWIRAIRDALGMSGAQLGKRVGLCKQRIPRIEEDEVLGNVTLKTMRRIAEAMDCTFVYALIPRTSLDETRRKQAEKIAKARLQRTSQTMCLEGQGISDEEEIEVLNSEIEVMLSNLTWPLWEDSDGV